MSDTIPKETLPFRMVIEDIFTIKNRGVVVTGTTQSGTIRKNDTVIVMSQDKMLRVTVSGFELINSRAPRTDNTALLLRNVQREDIDIGMIVTTEGL